MKELSKKNENWLSQERYLELRHFALQYDDWKRMLNTIDSLRTSSIVDVKHTATNNPVEAAVIQRAAYISKINMVEQACKDADIDIWEYLLESITQGVSYDILNARQLMPVSRSEFYKKIREAYFNLHMLRE